MGPSLLRPNAGLELRICSQAPDLPDLLLGVHALSIRSDRSAARAPASQVIGSAGRASARPAARRLPRIMGPLLGHMVSGRVSPAQTLHGGL